MRKLIVSIMVSVDGMFEDADKNIEWHVWDDEMESYMLDMLTNKVDTILLGRKAYQVMEDYWPVSKEPIAQPMNELPKLVFSRSLETVKWSNARLIKDNLKEEITALKNMPGKDLVLFGGAEIASEFIRLGLVDEYMLMVNPVILGSGNPFFKNIEQAINLKLTDTKTFKCGNVLLHYTPV